MDKKPILIIMFFLNTLIMIMMGLVIWGENLFIAERVVDFCYFIFIINFVISTFYSIIIFLFLFKKMIILGYIIYNKLTPKEKNYIIPQKAKVDAEENGGKNKGKILDFFKDPDKVIMAFKIFLVFLGIFLAFFIFRIIWYKIL